MKIPELPSAKAVSPKIVKNVWKKISDKPFPDVYAFIVDDKDFFFLLERVQENPSMKDTRVKEYGVNFDNRFIEAFSFKVKGHFLIVIKKSVPLNASLEHELRHLSPKSQ
jgi:hypothetical protein